MAGGDGPVAGTAHDPRAGVTPRECLALQLCYQAGWSSHVLAMAFQTSESKVWAHINQTCNHDYATIDTLPWSDDVA